MDADSLRYSADIDIWLNTPEFGRIPLAQAAPTFVIAAEPRQLPRCDAEIVLVVDGQEYRRPVTLTRGMSPERTLTAVSARDDIPI